MENRVDEEYFKIILLKSQYIEQIDFASLMILRDFTDFMERVADRCADTSDSVRLLVVGEEKL
jgi:uncharacterized protein Yka (UPF0111/DUF47 family)